MTRPHSQALLPEFGTVLCHIVYVGINWLHDSHETMVWSFFVAYNQPAFLSSEICRFIFLQQILATEFRNYLRKFEPMTFIMINNWLNEEFKGPNQIH